MKTNLTTSKGSLFKKPVKNATCCDCMVNLHLVVDGEATNEQKDFLLAHLKDCISCNDSFQLEKSVKGLLRNKIERQICPQDVIENIRAKLK